jgi:aminoglycoside 3-N-acetyltransferase I
MNFHIKKLTADDINKFIELITLFESVFEMKDFTLPDEKYLRQLLAKEEFIVLAALSNDKIVGGLTAYLNTKGKFMK